jgi:glucose/arabinose dehydrogenase/plastocyanin
VLAVAVVALLAVMAILAPYSSAQDEDPIAPSVMDAVTPEGTLPGDPQIELVQIATGLVDPINVTNAGDGSGRLFVVERVGTVRIVQDGQVLADPFLDISSLVKTDFLEQGLLGLAFHPDYEKNGRFFVYYSDYSSNGRLTLQEFSVSDDPNIANDDTTSRILFQIEDPFTNHNGGTIKFGPDGYLYIAIGDGGSGGDPYDNAQDLDNMLGKILRIDVDSEQMPYGIPEDNPFAQAGQVIPRSQIEERGYYHPDGTPEIFMYGLRNPWQISFDSETGELYIADVGQGQFEEINVAEAGVGGQNYGWDYLEGTHCFPADKTECQPWGVPPVAEYSHGESHCSITGVGTYRGERSSSLNGIYFATDYCSGTFWGLTRDEAGAWVFAELMDTELLATGAGEGEDGELYVTSCSCVFGRDYDPYTQSQGIVWQIVAADQVGADDVTAASPVAEEAPVEEATPATEGESTPVSDAGGEAPSLVMVDIAFEPTQLTIAADTDVEIQLTNNGALPHNFAVPSEGIQSEDFSSGASGSITVNLPAGTYEFICSVPGHAAAGMIGTLTVE